MFLYFGKSLVEFLARSSRNCWGLSRELNELFRVWLEEFLFLLFRVYFMGENLEYQRIIMKKQFLLFFNPLQKKNEKILYQKKSHLIEQNNKKSYHQEVFIISPKQAPAFHSNGIFLIKQDLLIGQFLIILSINNYFLLHNSQKMDIIKNKSFNPIMVNSNHFINQEQFETQCRRIIEENQIIQISESEKQFQNQPLILRLILSIYKALARKFQRPQDSQNQEASVSKHLSTSLKIPIYKHLADIIQKKLFFSSTFQKYYQQISFSLIYKTDVFSMILSILSENTNYLAFERIINFYKILVSQQFVHYIPLQIYHLFGGSVFTISSKSFKEKFAHMIGSIGKVLSISDTIINRNIEMFQTNKERKLILDESIKMVMISRDNEAFVKISDYFIESLFGNSEYLKKEQFLFKLQSKPIEPLLSLFFFIIRSQATLMEEKSFQNYLLIRNEISKTNFYANEMTKLFNKCPFNGDERCNCKKCNCVRRNRESAKLSQEKKRNAVEQVDQYKKQIEQLQKVNKTNKQRISRLQLNQKTQVQKNRQLQEENMILKSFLKDMKSNPKLNSFLMQTIEPVSKVLNNQF